MTSWLDKQPDTVLKHWLRHTRSPMVASMPDGEVLWLNAAFVDLLGWTDVELIGAKSWHELTSDAHDLKTDKRLVQELVSGERTDYQLQKQMLTKGGTSKRVVIDVIRYPHVGDFECCLVSVFPTERGVDFALGELTQIRQLLVELMSVIPQDQDVRGLTFDKFVQFHKDKPLLAWAITLTIMFLLFGRSAIEIIRELIPSVPSGTPAN